MTLHLIIVACHLVVLSIVPVLMVISGRRHRRTVARVRATLARYGY